MRTQEEINTVITKLEARLQEPEAKLEKNLAIKLGFEKAIEMLKRHEMEYNLSGQVKTITPQSKGIAILSIDWLREFEVDDNIFVKIPFKS